MSRQMVCSSKLQQITASLDRIESNQEDHRQLLTEVTLAIRDARQEAFQYFTEHMGRLDESQDFTHLRLYLIEYTKAQADGVEWGVLWGHAVTLKNFGLIADGDEPGLKRKMMLALNRPGSGLGTMTITARGYSGTGSAATARFYGQPALFQNGMLPEAARRHPNGRALLERQAAEAAGPVAAECASKADTDAACAAAGQSDGGGDGGGRGRGGEGAVAAAGRLAIGCPGRRVTRSLTRGREGGGEEGEKGGSDGDDDDGGDDEEGGGDDDDDGDDGYDGGGGDDDADADDDDDDDDDDDGDDDGGGGGDGSDCDDELGTVVGWLLVAEAAAGEVAAGAAGAAARAAATTADDDDDDDDDDAPLWVASVRRSRRRSMIEPVATCPVFLGRVRGCVFKTGDRGTGYYLERGKAKRAAAKEGSCSSRATKRGRGRGVDDGDGGAGEGSGSEAGGDVDEAGEAAAAAALHEGRVSCASSWRTAQNCRPEVTAAVMTVEKKKRAEGAWAEAAVVAGSSRAALMCTYEIRKLGSWRQAEFDNRDRASPCPHVTRVPLSGLQPGYVFTSPYKKRTFNRPFGHNGDQGAEAARDSPAARGIDEEALETYTSSCVRMPPCVRWLL
jgi:hypothetical protein